MAVSLTQWQLGQTASTMVTLPQPNPEVSRPLTLIGGTHTNLAGGTSQDVVARKRQWTLEWEILSDTDADLILQFWDGRKGLGPFTFNDPTKSGLQTTVNLTGLDDTTLWQDWLGMGYRKLTLNVSEV